MRCRPVGLRHADGRTNPTTRRTLAPWRRVANLSTADRVAEDSLLTATVQETGRGAGCCRRNSSRDSLGIDICWPFLEPAISVPPTAPAATPIPAPFPPPAIPPIKAPRPAPPIIFFAVFPPSPFPFTS